MNGTPFMIAVLLINVDDVVEKGIHGAVWKREAPQGVRLCSSGVGDLYALLRTGKLNSPCTVEKDPRSTVLLSETGTSAVRDMRRRASRLAGANLLSCGNCSLYTARNANAKEISPPN